MFFLFRYNWGQTIGAAIVALGSLLLIGSMQLRQFSELSRTNVEATPEQIQRELESDQLYLKLMRVTPALGFDNIIADLVFLRFLQYFGDEPARKQTGFQLSPDFFDIILNQDPYFLDAYLFLSSSTSLFAGLPERSVGLMERELQVLGPKKPPQAYYVWRYKGTDELLFLGDAQASRHSYEMAANWASQYSDRESQYIAESSLNTASFLAKNPKSKTAQVQAWIMVLSNAQDDRTRKIVVERIRALGGDLTFDAKGQPSIRFPPSD